jgi:DNA-binding transcriptional ArsR family regulator
MKRNMDLVRDILFRLEEKSDPVEWLRPDDVKEYSPSEVGYHIKLMYEAGLIEAEDCTTSDSPLAWIAYHPTWEGHDFLEAARNEGIWSKAKSIIASKGGSMTFEILKHLLVKLVEDNIFDSP